MINRLSRMQQNGVCGSRPDTEEGNRRGCIPALSQAISLFCLLDTQLPTKVLVGGCHRIYLVKSIRSRRLVDARQSNYLCLYIADYLSSANAAGQESVIF